METVWQKSRISQRGCILLPKLDYLLWGDWLWLCWGVCVGTLHSSRRRAESTLKLPCAESDPWFTKTKFTLGQVYTFIWQAETLQGLNPATWDPINWKCWGLNLGPSCNACSMAPSYWPSFPIGYLKVDSFQVETRFEDGNAERLMLGSWTICICVLGRAWRSSDGIAGCARRKTWRA